MKSKLLFVGAFLLLLALALAACNSAPPEAATQPAPVVQPTAKPCPTAAPAPECPAPPTPVVENVPFQDAWANSPHNDVTAEAFNHWNDADPKEIPTSCAKCHSTPGYQDYLGADGTEAGVVNNAAPVGTTIQCVACHNSATATLTSVTFPSGAEITGLGPSARCMVCHQGRESKVSVDQAITDNGAADDVDKVVSDLSFINVHYFFAGATLYGSEAHGGYEYDGKSYDIKFAHVDGYDNCIACHDQHSLEVRVDQCAVCHDGVTSKDDLKNIRMAGSQVDYDGDGDVTEGISGEISGLRDMLMQAIQAYATEVAGAAIAYTPDSHPYFFVDTNGNGQVDQDEATRDNAYKSFTARLLKATYNYQFSVKDPGNYAHNGKYVIELLYDSIEDLNSKISTPVDLSNAHRTDAGHFDGSAAPFRHWDEEGEVSADCARCHSATGLPFYLSHYDATKFPLGEIAQPISDGFKCSTCHNDIPAFTRYEAGPVTFPSGAVLDTGSSDANLCSTCHQARESTVSVDKAIAASGLKDNEPATAEKPLRFVNSHYFGAAATRWGTEAKGAYEYAGETYSGRFTHVEAFDTCTECHDVHKLTVNTDKCSACHGSEDPTTFRNPAGDSTDYDGDGDTSEGIAGEVETMSEKLYTAIQGYTAAQNLPAIVYDTNRYPYFYEDTNGNGTIDEGEKAYSQWTPNLLRAAYNLQWYNKDPGAFAHNGMYMMQVLYDSIKSMGGDVTGMTRPPVTAPAQ